MRLSEKRVSEFQRNYENRFTETLTDEDATKYAHRFYRLLEIIYTPLRHEELLKVRARSDSLRDNSDQG